MESFGPEFLAVSRYSGLVTIRKKRILGQTWEVVFSAPLKKRQPCRFLFVGLLNPWE